jgi:hypothetical protein
VAQAAPTRPSWPRPRRMRRRRRSRPPRLSGAAAQAPPPLRRRRRSAAAIAPPPPRARRLARASAACAADAGRGRERQREQLRQQAPQRGGWPHGQRVAALRGAGRPRERRAGWSRLCDEIARAARSTRPPLHPCRDERVGVEDRQQRRGLAARDDVRREVAASARSRQRENAAALLVGLAGG